MKQQRPTSDDKKEEKSQQEKRKNACNVCIAQWTELHEEIRKSQQPIDLNTLMQNHKNDLKKPYTKIYEKCSLQLLYDEKNTSKI